MPRLRGRFEPENNPSNALPGDINSADENFTEPPPTSQQFSPILQKDKGIGKTELGLSSDTKPVSSENTPQPSIRTDKLVKPFNITNDQLLKEPTQNTAKVINEVVEPVESTHNEKIIEKENHLVITNYHKTINEELIFNQENEHVKENDISPTGKTNSVNPLMENSDFAITPRKHGGLLGEPPAFNNRKINQNFPVNHSDHQTAPVIKVSIGQINVRAVTPPQVSAKKPKMVPKPTLSLEDYLKQRTKGN